MARVFLLIPGYMDSILDMEFGATYIMTACLVTACFILDIQMGMKIYE